MWIFGKAHNSWTHPFQMTKVWWLQTNAHKDQWILMKKVQKFTDVMSDSIFHNGFEKLPFVRFWCNMKEEYLHISGKVTKTPPSPFPATYLYKVWFLHRLQSNSIITDWHQNQIGHSHCLIKWNMKEIQKNIKQCHLSPNYFYLEDIVNKVF